MDLRSRYGMGWIALGWISVVQGKVRESFIQGVINPSIDRPVKDGKAGWNVRILDAFSTVKRYWAGIRRVPSRKRTLVGMTANAAG